MSVTEDLMAMKRKIDEAVREKDKLEGRIQQVKDDLKREHKVNSLKEAKNKLIKMEEELAQQKELFEEQVRELEESYNDDGE